VDTGLGGQGSATPKTSDKWSVTHGDAQYQWLKQTLEQSTAKWKFVFAHHVMGTGRGGIEIAGQFEWGGYDAKGVYGFTANRPGWPMPIHQLMVANNVTIFFQGHDHVYAHQQLDGVTYQSLPNPADNTYTAFNADAYTSGDVFPNAGYVKVTVGPDSVKVDYIREFLPEDENPPDQVSGAIQFSYTIPVSAQ
jgi:phosphodiesterase/alkaline phosphatase D-like protein